MRILATTTILDDQPAKGLVVEFDNEGVISRLLQLSDMQTETAHTLYIEGTLRGDIRIGASAHTLTITNHEQTIYLAQHPMLCHDAECPNS